MATNPIDAALEAEGIVEEQPTPSTAPIYRVLGDSKIPVSKKMGFLWKSRRDQAQKAREGVLTCWDEAIRYYEHDQLSHRKSADNRSGNTVHADRLNQEWTETENVVFANASLMVPMLYMRNPHIEFSYDTDAVAPLAEACECLINKLFRMRDAPGLNMKTKIRRTTLAALLTNSGYLKVNWVTKQDSNEQALADLQRLSEKLSSTTEVGEIRKVEGEILALEEKINMLSPSGPQVLFKLPHQILVDPTSIEPDHRDAMWMMEWDFLPTAYLNAVYTVDGRSVYEPTHVLSNNKAVGTGGEGGNSVEEEVNNFSLLTESDGNNPNAYGYTTKEQFEQAQYTKVWWVWDRTTRRVYLFCDNYWRWPVWVWDDPLRLPRFFPYFRLHFVDSAVQAVGKGETTYYLDQQDAINEINDEMRRARHWARRNIFYNKSVVKQEDVQLVLNGPDGTARGVEVPEGTKMQDLFFSIVPPSMRFPELFDPEPKLQAINRITGINDAQRGAQFKTNTTNQAIETYNQSIEVRRDDKIDLIEDFVADIGWNITMLCLMNWETSDVLPIIGANYAQYWQRMPDPRTFLGLFSPQVEAGSTEKPNSKGKQQTTLQMAQILGQFASASPAMVVPMLKMFQRAFPDFVITKEEWELILMTMQMSLTKAGSGPGAEESPADAQGQQPQGQGQNDGY